MWIDRRWYLVGLACSLLINVFLIGILAGHLFGGDRRAVPKPGTALVPAAHVRALPPEERRRFQTAMRSHRDAIRAARMAHRAARQAVEAAIAAPTYDRQAVEDKFAALRQSNVALQEAVNAALVDALQDLSQQSRESLVERARPLGQPAAPQ